MRQESGKQGWECEAERREKGKEKKGMEGEGRQTKKIHKYTRFHTDSDRQTNKHIHTRVRTRAHAIAQSLVLENFFLELRPQFGLLSC